MENLPINIFLIKKLIREKELIVKLASELKYTIKEEGNGNKDYQGE